ncbi:MAG: pyridoxamine 5'-phosphate oxidase family protein [Planctomycetes bacterium]|nr:pyridoxamine 5'-phosphate oxidase family protein [Planctomycetota bacterium]
MGKGTTRLDTAHRTFIERQRIFFVASAPLARTGHVNLSPKGLDTFRVLDAETVAYLDLTGSGAETIAHMRENGRITLMFCAFDGAPNILRIYGRGEVLLPGTEGFDRVAPDFQVLPGTRSILLVHVEKVSTSCGYGIPVYRHKRDRDQLVSWADRKGEGGVGDFQRKHNERSIDGLPALDQD